MLLWEHECCLGDCREIYCCCAFVLLGTTQTNAWVSLREFYTSLHSSLHLNCCLWMPEVRQHQFAHFQLRPTVVPPRDNIFTSCFLLTLPVGLLGGMTAPPVQTRLALVFPKGQGGTCWNELYKPEWCQWATRPKSTRPPDHQEQLDEIQGYCTGRGLAD